MTDAELDKLIGDTADSIMDRIQRRRGIIKADLIDEIRAAIAKALGGRLPNGHWRIGTQ